jgi:hypothetical protein
MFKSVLNINSFIKRKKIMKKKNVIPYRGITKAEYLRVVDKFQDMHGYMTKLCYRGQDARGRDTSFVTGYLTRVEVPNKNFGTDKKVVVITYHPIAESELTSGRVDSRFNKAIAMNKAMSRGIRKIKKYIKENGSLADLESGSIIHAFRSPEEIPDQVLETWKNSGFDYKEYYNYIQVFENKIKKYYNDNEVLIVVV